MLKKKLQIHRDMKTKHKKDLVKSKRIIPVSTCIILVDSQGYVQYNDQPVRRKEYQQKDGIEEPIEKCEDTELRDHAVPLHKDFSNQRTTWRSQIKTSCSHCWRFLKWWGMWIVLVPRISRRIQDIRINKDSTKQTKDRYLNCHYLVVFKEMYYAW